VKSHNKVIKSHRLYFWGRGSLIDHCGTFGIMAIDAAKRASETEKEMVYQNFVA